MYEAGSPQAFSSSCPNKATHLCPTRFSPNPDRLPTCQTVEVWTLLSHIDISTDILSLKIVQLQMSDPDGWLICILKSCWTPAGWSNYWNHSAETCMFLLLCSGAGVDDMINQSEEKCSSLLKWHVVACCSAVSSLSTQHNVSPRSCNKLNEWILMWPQKRK